MNRKPRRRNSHDLVEHLIHVTRTRSLSVRPPDRAERAVLRASAHRLHRGPHVAPGRQQIPPTRKEGIAFEPTTLVLDARSAGRTVAEDLGPCAVTIASDHGVRATELARLVRIQRCVDAAEHDIRACCPGRGADFVATECVACVDADTDDVTRPR